MTPEQIEKERVKFESIFSQAPYEFDTARYPSSEGWAWPGQYTSYHVYAAWESWLVRAELDQEKKND